MAIAATMNQDNGSHETRSSSCKQDEHENDMVMPGFRFHPTEEELVEFYLRRKVEGKRFNVELITFLDLYRYDPWELPALAAIGEKEWFFYVPRDRKYRNGDRPNRVTTSGYWKATGADRMIRTENFRSIGLKKTLVFYSGKAPKGIRTSWIMNEYRLPQHETERLQKAEISLCRVYKRAGVEDHPSLPRSLPTRASSSRATNSDKKQPNPSHHHHAIETSSFHSFEGQSSSQHQPDQEKMSETSASSTSTDIVGTALGLSNHVVANSNYNIIPLATPMTATLPPQQTSSLVPNINCTAMFPNTVDDLHRIISYQQASVNPPQPPPPQLYHTFSSQFSTDLHSHSQPQPQSLVLNNLDASIHATFPDRLWEWNPLNEASKDYTNPFK